MVILPMHVGCESDQPIAMQYKELFPEILKPSMQVKLMTVPIS